VRTALRRLTQRAIAVGAAIKLQRRREEIHWRLGADAKIPGQRICELIA
jgi:hypothetical protein